MAGGGTRKTKAGGRREGWRDPRMSRRPGSKEKNCFDMIEWKAVREAASRYLPKHTAAARREHRNLSVEQEGVLPMPKDRGAEQGDVHSSGSGGG